MVRGKEDAQCGHAAIAWIACRLGAFDKIKFADFLCGHFTEIEIDWLRGRNKKVALTVSSEEELLEIARQAREAGILCYVIKDEGLTQFGGIPTNTCLALGPDFSDKIDRITGHLKLR